MSSGDSPCCAQVWTLCALGTTRVVSGSWDTSLRVWDVPTGHCVATLQGHHEKARCGLIYPHAVQLSTGPHAQR